MLAWVDLYNETVQILRDAIVSGQNLDYLKIVNSGVSDRAVKGNLPGLTVWPTFDPNEVWVAVPDVREGLFTVSITVMQEPEDKNFPFGRSSRMAIFCRRTALRKRRFCQSVHSGWI